MQSRPPQTGIKLVLNLLLETQYDLVTEAGLEALAANERSAIVTNAHSEQSVLNSTSTNRSWDENALST